MCGLAGILLKPDVSRAQAEQLPTLLAAMTESLRPRGPDAMGYHLRAPIALGHRRLSILDLTETGAQPMQIGVGGAVISYNGECYNFAELRRNLESEGCSFRGHSDTEVILHAYATWGLSGLKRLEGIFALALWDAQSQRLVLMRDRLGVKPLFHGECSVGLAFGSEIKAVLAAGGVDSEIDQQAFSEYLWFGNAYEDRTFHRGVRALPPGHWLIAEGGRTRIEAWWRIEEWLEEPTAARDPREAAIQVRDALDAAVARQMVSDVPVGIFLSGGVDSSAIAAAAVRARGRPISSYCASFDFDQGINEQGKAALVARHLGMRHHELRIDGPDLPDVLVRMARAHDEPFADAANIPLYLMCRALQGGIKVVLQGDGGDELFAGYRRYAMLRNAHWWRMVPRPVATMARAAGRPGRRLARMIEALGTSEEAMRMGLLLTVESPADPPEAVLDPAQSPDGTVPTDPFRAYRQAARRFTGLDPVQQMLLTDFTVQLPSQFLAKVDRSTMAAGIEARVPLLDDRLVRLAVGMPSGWKVRGAQKKIVLRNSQRDRLPAEILDGPKTGFGVPYEHWLRTSLYGFARDRILDRGFLTRFSFAGDRVERLLERHRSGADERGFMVWKLLQLAVHWGETSRPQAASPSIARTASALPA